MTFAPFGNASVLSVTQSSQTFALPTFPTEGAPTIRLLNRQGQQPTRYWIKLGDNTVTVDMSTGWRYRVGSDDAPVFIGVPDGSTHIAIFGEGSGQVELVAGGMFPGDLITFGATVSGRLIIADIGGTNRYEISVDGSGNLDVVKEGGGGTVDFDPTLRTGGLFLTAAGWRIGSVVTPSTLGSNQGDYNPPSGTTTIVYRLSASTPVTIAGLDPNSDGRVYSLINVGTENITLLNEDAGATASWRFAFNANVVLKPSDAILLWYDGVSDRWRPLSYVA